MLGNKNLKQALNVDLSISSEMQTALERWALIYQNQAPWVKYDLENSTPNDVYSMNLGVAIASEIARTATIEMVATVSGSPRADYLSESLQRVVKKLRHQIEFGCAKGGLAMKPYVDGDKLAVDFVQADEFYPVDFNSDGDITSAVFVDRRKIGRWWFTRLEYHSITEYEGLPAVQILNKAYRSSTEETLGNEVSLESVDEWADLEPDVIVKNVQRPLFGYFRFPKANAVDPDSPLGVSCYAGAEDLIRQADKQWSRFLWEVEAGEMAVHVDETALARDSTGKVSLPNKRLYRSLGSGATIGEGKLFQEWAPNLRVEEQIRALDKILMVLEFQTGLAYGTLVTNPQNIDKTATEIKMSKQRTAATITDTQKAIEKALDGLLFAMDVHATLYKLAPVGSYEAAYEFDDSIIVDKEFQRVQDLNEVNRGIMSKVEYRMRNYGETEAQARQALQMVEDERKPIVNMPGEE
ncbi:MAG: hypothetical protein SVT56_01785 [Chloroflexota bacterium]|nr:hypothetical protein [Chloroflexota bacterium]